MVSCPKVRQFYSLNAFPERLLAAHGRTVIVDNYPWTGIGTAMRTEHNERNPTNKEYAALNTAFKDACARAKVEPNARQASKFRNSTGAAYAALKKG